MKIIGYCIYLLSVLWLLIVGLHTFTHLLRTLANVPPALRWFWALPLPDHTVGWEGTWPIMLGIGGAITGTLLAKLASPSEKPNPEESEA